jgi:ribosomal protein S18 acetylase RimI-like enzyme
MEGLLDCARGAGVRGLALSVSERNGVAVRLYEAVGFVHAGRTRAELLMMTWSAERGTGSG